MKITRSQLKQLIIEEMLMEDRAMVGTSGARGVSGSGGNATGGRNVDSSNLEEIVKRMFMKFRGGREASSKEEAELSERLAEWVSKMAAAGLDVTQEPHKTKIEAEIRAQYSAMATMMLARVLHVGPSGKYAQSGSPDIGPSGYIPPVHSDDW